MNHTALPAAVVATAAAALLACGGATAVPDATPEEAEAGAAASSERATQYLVEVCLTPRDDRTTCRSTPRIQTIDGAPATITTTQCSGPDEPCTEQTLSVTPTMEDGAIALRGDLSVSIGEDVRAWAWAINAASGAPVEFAPDLPGAWVTQLRVVAGPPGQAPSSTTEVAFVPDAIRVQLPTP